MRKIFITTILLMLIGGVSATVRAQATAAVKPTVVVGEVGDVSASKITLKTKDGAIDVALTDQTEYKRVSPDKPSLATATAATFGDIETGDKVAVTGFLATDKKSIPARAVYLMTKADIAGKQQKDQNEWKTRGITGQVTAINAASRAITVSSRGIGAATTTMLTAKPDADFRRYSANSVNYNEAQASSFDDIKVGDSIRAIGDKSADGAEMQAERIISGSFQTIAGTITAIDATKNEITITNIQTKKPVIIVVGENSILKQFPAEMAQRMAAAQSGATTGMQPPAGMRPPRAATPTDGQNAAPNNEANGGAGMRRGGGMRGAGGIDEMLDRFPTITVADLKVGEMVAFSGTKTVNADRVTAIKLLSGIEPFIKNALATGGTRGGRGGRGGGQDSGFTIPGLDGGGF